LVTLLVAVKYTIFTLQIELIRKSYEFNFRHGSPIGE
jgi:hypothetical protein